MAQTSSASAALGAGMFDSHAATTLDLGMDVASDVYAMGLGARLSWVMNQGFRAEEWDEPSEWSRLIRYLAYVREAAPVRANVVAGELGSTSLGHGALVRGYTTGIELDHRGLGLDVRLESARFGAEAVVDDVVAPAIVGARGYWHALGPISAAQAGLSLAADLEAPVHEGAMLDAAVLPMAAMDASAGLHTRDQRWSTMLHAELAAIATMALGLHAGLSNTATLGHGTKVSVRAEISLGTDRYVPGWMGPLYEIERMALARRTRMPGQDMSTQLDAARMGGMAGMGSLVELGARDPGLGEVNLLYARRPGLSDVWVGRITAPYVHSVQAGAWFATEIDGSASTWIVASELRAQLSTRLFVSAELARLYRHVDHVMVPTWIASAAVGAVLDF